MIAKGEPLGRVCAYARSYRHTDRPLHPSATADALRSKFAGPMPAYGADGAQIIADLIAAAEPGLVGNTDPNFNAWVMGASDPVGVAADWLTSIWGQNAAIYQCSPAAAIAEEAVSAWLLDLLDLPRDSSVGFVTGATMATFTGLAVARSEVLRRAGHNFEEQGLQGAPFATFFASDEVHVSDLTAIRHLGFGAANIRLLHSDAQGLMRPETLAQAMAETDGPKVVIAQAGQINSGGFEIFAAISAKSKHHDAWLHVDGVFGLWALTLPERAHLTHGVDMADSCSFDGHKWLQIPYDSGFAIIRDEAAHRRAMEITATYLPASDEDGRNPSAYVPGLSRRARGFTAWAVLKSLGRSGAETLIRTHCNAAKTLADRISQIDGLQVLCPVHLNQVILGSAGPGGVDIKQLATRLNAAGTVFVKTAQWRGDTILRLSVISSETDETHACRLADEIKHHCLALLADGTPTRASLMSK